MSAVWIKLTQVVGDGQPIYVNMGVATTVVRLDSRTTRIGLGGVENAAAFVSESPEDVVAKTRNAQQS